MLNTGQGTTERDEGNKNCFFIINLLNNFEVHGRRQVGGVQHTLRRELPQNLYSIAYTHVRRATKPCQLVRALPNNARR